MRLSVLSYLLLGSLAASAQTLPLTPAEREILPILTPGSYQVTEKAGSWFVPSPTDALSPQVRQALIQTHLSGDDTPALVNGTLVRLVKTGEFDATHEPGGSGMTYSAAFVEVLDGKFVRKRGWLVVATMQNARAGEGAIAYGSKHLRAVTENGQPVVSTAKAVRATNPLHTAIAGGDANLVRAQLKPEFINQPNSRGRTPLIEAADRGKPESVSLLIDAGAEVEARDDEGRTALYAAAAASRYECVRVLLAKGANLTVVATDGYTPLMVASRRGNLETVDYLIKAGADVNTKDANGRTALTFVRQAKTGNWRGVERALETAGGKE